MSGTSSSCNSVPRQFSKAIVIIVDALKYEFAVYNESVRPEVAKPFQNRLPVFKPERGGRLFEFVADPPTTTMQRLKGLMTGETSFFSPSLSEPFV
jgi:phosphatidylinositol glycan class O